MNQNLLYVLVASIAACTFGGRNNMNEREDPILNFKAKIGFDNIVEPGGPNSGVVVEWPTSDTAIPLVNQGWTLDSLEVLHRQSGAEGEWIFKKGEETIVLQIFASSLGQGPARNRLIDIASATTMMEIPFKKSNPPLGTLSVNVPRAEGGDYIWVFRNICFNAETIDTDADIYAFARWVQSIAESGAVKDLRLHLPQIKSVKVDPPIVNVGETFSVRAIPSTSPDSDVDRYSFKFLHDREALDWEYQEANVAEFAALKSRNTEITVQVVDRKTLLSNWQTIMVKIED